MKTTAELHDDPKLKERECRHCEEIKNYFEFKKDASQLHGISYSCKACTNLQAIARRKSAPFISQAKKHPSMTVYEQFFLLGHSLEGQNHATNA